MENSDALRLLAEDAEDIKVIAAALQDSVLKAGNMRYDVRQRRFTLEVNRYRWEREESRSRVRAILAVEGVISVRARAVSKGDPDMIYSLLSLEYTPDQDPPGGQLNLLFAGDGEIELMVEALEVTLLDSRFDWPTPHKPDHDRKK